MYMSRTVSFRCSEELDEFLEQEAERRMTTKSAVAQMIVAEYAKDVRGESVGEEETDEESEAEEETAPEENGQESEELGDQEVLEKYSEHWYEPDGYKNNYAVEPPEDVDDDRRYFKTAGEAAKRLKQWYA